MVIFYGDFLDIAKYFRPQKFDVVIADPPMNIADPPYEHWEYCFFEKTPQI